MAVIPRGGYVAPAWLHHQCSSPLIASLTRLVLTEIMEVGLCEGVKEGLEESSVMTGDFPSTSQGWRQ